MCFKKILCSTTSQYFSLKYVLRDWKSFCTFDVSQCTERSFGKDYIRHFIQEIYKLTFNHILPHCQIKFNVGDFYYLKAGRCHWIIFLLNTMVPWNMWKWIHQNWCKVLGKFWSLFLAILYHIICQIKEGQFSTWFSWGQNKGNRTLVLTNDFFLSMALNEYTQ